MATVTLHLPDETPLAALKQLADSVDCDLRMLPDGSYRARPRHSNANVVPMRRYQRVIARHQP